MFDLLLFVLLGVFSGFLSGLLGIGGGALVVPGLLWIFTLMAVPAYYSMTMAAATSLMVLVFTSLSAASIHLSRRNVLWPVVIRMLPWIVLGVLAGVFLASTLPAAVLKRIFALFLFSIAIKMALKIKPKQSCDQLKPMATRSAATLIGLLSGLLGIRGGTISVPYLIHGGVDMIKAVGTTAWVTLFVAILGAATFAVIGGHVTVSWTTGYIYWPAVLSVVPCSVLMTRWGAWCGRRLQPDHLRRIFALILLVLSIKMAF